MTVIIKRINDNFALDVSSKTKMQPTAEVFGASFSKTFYPGPNGESILLSSAADKKTFTLNFTSKDTTGVDQTKLMDYFRKSFANGTWYSLTDTVMGITNFEFAVLEISPGKTEIGITCQARYSTEPNRTVINLYKETVAAGTSSKAVNVTFTQQTVGTSSIQVSLTFENGSTTWSPTAGAILKITNSAGKIVGYVQFSLSRLSDITSDPLSWRGAAFKIDSNREIVEGYGLISVINWKPFVTNGSGDTYTITLTSMANPQIVDILPWTLSVDAITTKED